MLLFGNFKNIYIQKIKGGHHFFTAFSNFDFGVTMMFIKNVLNKDC